MRDSSGRLETAEVGEEEEETQNLEHSSRKDQLIGGGRVDYRSS